MATNSINFYKAEGNIENDEKNVFLRRSFDREYLSFDLTSGETMIQNKLIENNAQ